MTLTQTIHTEEELLSAEVSHTHELGCAYFKDFKLADCACSEKRVFADKVKASHQRILQAVVVEIEGMMRPVHDNWASTYDRDDDRFDPEDIGHNEALRRVIKKLKEV